MSRFAYFLHLGGVAASRLQTVGWGDVFKRGFQ
jgi:hypothetical protein